MTSRLRRRRRPGGLAAGPRPGQVALEDAKACVAEVFGSRFAFGADIYAEQAGALLAVEGLQEEGQREEGTVNLYRLVLHILAGYGEMHRVRRAPGAAAGASESVSVAASGSESRRQMLAGHGLMHRARPPVASARRGHWMRARTPGRQVRVH